MTKMPWRTKELSKLPNITANYGRLFLNLLIFASLLSSYELSNGSNNSISFNGLRTDSYTGYQFLGNGYRAYNPMIKRFMAYDSMSPFDEGGFNGYVYVNNNPMIYSDPSGHSPKLSFSFNKVHRLNKKDLKKPLFKPKKGDTLDDGNYQFVIKSSLSNDDVNEIKKWSTYTADSGSLYSIAKSQAKEILDQKYLSKDDFYSLSYREGKLIGVVEFNIFPRQKIVEVANTTSSPFNLSSQNQRISGFGAKMTYEGLKHAFMKSDILVAESTAISHPMMKINDSLGFILTDYK